MLKGDFAMAIATSALRQDPYKIEILIFPREVTEEDYITIDNSFTPRKRVPLYFTLVPRDSIVPWALSDHAQRISPSRCIAINGEFEGVYANKDRVDYLSIHNVALKYIETMEALTPENIERRGRFIPKINAIITSPIALQKTLKNISGEDLPHAFAIPVSTTPTPEQIVDKFVRANIEMQYVLGEYLTRVQ
jgi:hypothetical protein